jgi:hypothetical protein
MTTCTFPGCPHRAVSHGLCSGHRSQRERGAELTPLGPRGPRPSGLETVRLRLRPETVEVIASMASDGEDARSRARRMLEAMTGTTPES